MLIEVATKLPCPPEVAWRQVKTSRLLNYISYPLVVFRAVEPPALPEQWSEGEYLVSIYLFGLIPLGSQWIVTSVLAEEATPGQQHYQMRDNGRGSIARRWDHVITLQETVDGLTSYSDRIELEAGWLTPLVWTFAQLFYRYRQLRWLKLARTNFSYAD